MLCLGCINICKILENLPKCHEKENDLLKLFYSFNEKSFMDLLHLIENTFDRKRISANPSPNPNSDPNPEA